MHTTLLPISNISERLCTYLALLVERTVNRLSQPVIDDFKTRILAFRIYWNLRSFYWLAAAYPASLRLIAQPEYGPIPSHEITCFDLTLTSFSVATIYIVQIVIRSLTMSTQICSDTIKSNKYRISLHSLLSDTARGTW